MAYELTEHGRQIINDYLTELQAKRKEILDAGKDTIDEIPALPTVQDIFDDLMDVGFDDYGEAYNGWYVTDNYDADYPIMIKLGRDVVKV